VRAAAKRISERMPDFMESAAVAALMEGGMLDALKTQDLETQDARQEVENADRGDPVGYFYAGGIRRPIYAAKSGTPLSEKWQSQPLSVSKKAGSILAAIRAADSKEQGAAFSLGRIDDALAARILEATELTGTARDVKGMEFRIDSDFVTHARRFHPNLTESDFLRIPEILNKAPLILSGENDRGMPTVNFKIKRSSREFLLVGVQLNKRGQLSMNTFKKSAEGKSL
jgi:hypothetical protein